VIVEVRGHDILAYAWREPLRVSTDLENVFPELGSSIAAAGRVEGDARRRTEIAVKGVRCAPVAALVWIEQGPQDCFEPLAPAEALIELVRQSAWVLIADGGSGDHLDALRQVASSVPSFRLVHSPKQLVGIERTLASAVL
jgi:hypothetical protein